MWPDSPVTNIHMTVFLLMSDTDIRPYTERTFFRYFADKREVLFGGSKDLELFRELSPYSSLTVLYSTNGNTDSSADVVDLRSDGAAHVVTYDRM